jgi:signal recognition particle receptor subunit beta
LEDNLNTLLDLEQNLISMGRSLENFPFVIQFNKWDLPNVSKIDTLQNSLNFHKAPCFKSVATEGLGVFETLKEIINQVTNRIQQKV